MRRILAIAVITARSAIRSRLFLILMLLLILAVVGLPLTIEGDGTIEGRVKVLLHYTLGFAGIILAVASLWISCGTIAQEIDERQIHLTVVKPVGRFQLWIGKWAGIVCMNACLLFLSGAVVYLLLSLSLSEGRVSADDRARIYRDILVGRRGIDPFNTPIGAEEIHDEIDRMTAMGIITEDMPHQEAAEKAYQRVVAKRSTVYSGTTKEWAFNTGDVIPVKASDDYVKMNKDLVMLGILLRVSASVTDVRPVVGKWYIGTEEDSKQQEYEMVPVKAALNNIRIPVDMSRIKGYSGELRVTFENASAEISKPAVFDRDEAVMVLVRTSSFLVNFIRSIVIIIGYLALVSAIGLAFSSMFSFPVAVFVAVSIVLIALGGHYYASVPEGGCCCCHAEHEAKEASLIKEMYDKSLKSLDRSMAPLMEFMPLGKLSDGRLVSWRFTGSALAMLMVIYSGVFALVGGVALRKRELALPAGT